MRQWKVVMPGMIAVVGMVLTGLLNAEDAKGKATLGNMQAAYKAASNAKTRCAAFAVKADEEGCKSVAILFRAIAESSAVQVRRFDEKIKRMGEDATEKMETAEVKSTKENLASALRSKTTEVETTYPAFMAQAKIDGDAMAGMSFNATVITGKEQAKFLEEAMEKMGEWKALGKAFAVCGVCGFTVMGPSPATCPVCSSPGEKYKVIE